MRSADRSKVIGACIASAAAFLPFHVMALLVALAVRDGRVDPSTSGWISSCYMLGILVGTVTLPASGIAQVSKHWAYAVVALMCCSLWIGVGAGLALLLMSWVIVGVCSGVLSLLGSLSAAAYHDRHFAFALRLSLVLFSSAGFMVAAQTLDRFNSYEQVITLLTVFFVLIASLGLSSYEPVQLPSQAPNTESLDGRAWVGILLLLGFFATQPGFWAYSAHIAETHGIESGPLPYLYAMSKVVGGITLLRWGANSRAGQPTVWLGVLLGASVYVMAVTSSLYAFGIALVLFEVVVNMQSTRLQATIATRNPRMAGLWIPACVAGGAAGGTALHGSSIGHGFELVFVASCILAGVLPAFVLSRRTQ